MRKAKPKKRIILPDPKYGDVLVTKFVNNIMLKGKKNLAYEIFYSAMDIVGNKLNEDPISVWKKALENVTPQVEVRSRRIGGQNYQVPVEVRPERKQTLGLRWLVKYARLRNDKTMEEKLAKEIMDSANGLGGACKKREDTHKMAEANRAFAHYRW